MYGLSIIFYSPVLLWCGLQQEILLRHITVTRNWAIRIESGIYRGAAPVLDLPAIVGNTIHPIVSFCFIVAALFFYIVPGLWFLLKMTGSSPAG